MSRPPTGTEQLDGRRARAERSRVAVVDALLDLLREGDPRPAADAIAERAGVSVRSVFRLFDDLDSIYATAVERQGRRIAPLLAAPPTTGPLTARIDALAEHRARLFEDIAPLRRAAVRTAPFHPPLQQGLAASHRQLRRQLKVLFERELGRRAPEEAAVLLDALDAATSWLAWEALRSEQHLSVRRARAALTRTVAALLAS
ncbi:MAG: TetR/AcrR family transcriptional regulator [Acidimicrobiales bacterium]|nr:TetR/AcrR family transcriptional regulator [Acidimicrobiales bacterium]